MVLPTPQRSSENNWNQCKPSKRCLNNIYISLYGNTANQYSKDAGHNYFTNIHVIDLVGAHKKIGEIL